VRLWIFAKDAERALAFYARVFGWSLPREHRSCWLVSSRDDPRLGPDGPAGTSTDHCDELCIPTVHVVDLDVTTATALAAGGELLVPRIALPGVGWLVYITDTEDNVLGIMQDDPDAALPQPPTTQPPATTSGPGPSPAG
jgi:predicted enzyme related to lactoylglutathione lyase